MSGPASAPTALSVVWDPPSAVVSFQPPVYGGECVDYYVVTAVSEDQDVVCNKTSKEHMYICSIPFDSDFNITAYSVTRGAQGLLVGESVECCKPIRVFFASFILLRYRFTFSRECNSH